VPSRADGARAAATRGDHHGDDKGERDVRSREISDSTDEIHEVPFDEAMVMAINGFGASRYQWSVEAGVNNGRMRDEFRFANATVSRRQFAARRNLFM
jgi:hypothetical protein